MEVQKAMQRLQGNATLLDHTTFEVSADKKKWTVRLHYISGCFNVLETF